MKLFVFLAVIICVGYRLSWNKNRQCDKSNQRVCDQFSGKKVNDDFAGGTVGAFFLLDEFIDPDVGEQKSVSQNLAQNEHVLDDDFEDDVFG